MTRFRFFLFRLALILFSFTPVVLATLILPAAASATTSNSTQSPVLEPKRVEQDVQAADFREDSFASLDIDNASTGVNTPAESAESVEQFSHLPPTTLEVAIISSPWVPLDHNSPDSSSNLVPRVSVVEAVVTNTGSVAAEDVSLNLDYPTDLEWSLLSGENTIREISELAPGEAFHGYWFADHSTAIGATHRYTVTASAHNASSVSTDDNFYGNPIGDQTVQTRAFISTGNSGATQTSAGVLLGVAFSVTVEYDLGSNPQFLVLSPVGNFDFDPSAYRLLSSKVRLFNDALTQEQIVEDRLYFEPLPTFAENAEVEYTFIAVKLADTLLCPYGAVSFGSTDKYDNKYCDQAAGNSVAIEGSVSLSLTKDVNSPVIQQGERLTYTLQYTNNGTESLTFAWIWDQVDTSVGSIITSTITPARDVNESDLAQGLVAWDVGTIPASASETFSFAVNVDGAGADLLDQTPLVNRGFFGISEGGLPNEPAITETVTTTVQAPSIGVSKTDGLTVVDTGSLTYTLQVVNAGSVDAVGLVITDVLPAEVQAGATTPITDSQIGSTLIWNIGTLASGGGTQVITIPVTVDSKTQNGALLTNEMTATYQNTVGYAFEPKTDTDTTTVNAPVLSISKSPSSDPAFVAPGGTPLTYTLDYNNVGDRAATGAVITDVIPVSTTFQTCSPSPCGTINSGTTVSWTVGTIPENGTGTVSFTVQLTDTLQTGNQIVNDDYGIRSDQNDFTAGDPLTVTASREAGFIQGTTFVDSNGNGSFDGGDGVLDNVTVTLFNSVNANTTITTTNASGEYKFRVEVPGPISVTAALPATYFRTTPGTVITQATLGITRTVDFGFAPDASSFGVLYGTVFEDIDHDGTQDVAGGEYGLKGVSVASSNAATSPVTTNDLGQYTFRYNSGGSVTITETNPANYVSTTPDVVAAIASIGSSGSSPVDFGDFLGIQISGQVFNDADVDGFKDGGEGGVSGAEVAAGADSFTTGSTGVYTLYVSLSDSSPVDIVETDPGGYLSTNAIPGTGMSKVDANTLRIGSPLSGTVYTDAYFGDVLASDAITVSGTVFEDLNANGQRDAGEGGLSGAVVSLSSGLTETTGSGGAFLLYGPTGTQITVTEDNPSGYVSTNAIPGSNASKVDLDTLVVSGLPGGSTSAGNLFGDALASSVSVITGTVFDDANENGVRNLGEGGLSGVQVSLEFEGGSIITETASGGLYQFAVAPGTDVQISSSGPGGAFYPTTPEAIFITPPSTGIFPDNDFGYSDDPDVAIILGTVFDDQNGNGEQDIGEPGLAGAEVSIAGIGSQTTSGSGFYAFVVSNTGIYNLNETNPGGYRSTTPDDVNVEVDSLGQSYLVDFGDTNSPNVATVFGLVFDDLNGNGSQDTSELGIAGVTIRIQVGNTVLISTTTKSFGQYTGGGDFGLEIGEEGVHTVREINLPGYRSTTPDAVNVNLRLGQSFNVDFGDTMTTTFSSIMGTVFEDIDGDGVYDLPSEKGISSVPVTLSNGDSTTSDDFGTYTFPISETGILEVAETDPLGYHSTTPNEVIVDVDALGQNYIVDFGDSQNPNVTSIFGTVFEDENVSGSRESTELGLSGVTVTITGTVLGFTPGYNTNRWGQYTFQIESLSTYTLTEEDLPGYVSTIAIPGDPAVTRLDNNNLRVAVNTLGISLGGNLFGDVQASQVITVSGQVWNDNGAGSGTPNDGVQNGSEAGLAGATVSLSSGLSQTTDASGSFFLYAPPGGTIDIVETNPSDYVSSDAIPGNNANKVDADSIRVDPLSAGATSAGNQFGDLLPADLGVVKTDSSDPVVAGTILTYTLIYTNNGPAQAQNVVISDVLDSEVVFGSVVSQPGSLSGPSQNGQTLSWTTSSLEVDASGTIVYTVEVDPGASGSLSNNAAISSAIPDTVSGNNIGSETTNVSREADLTIAKSDAPDPVAAGATLTYTLDYGNEGPSEALSVVISDVLDADVDFGGVVSQPGSLSGPSQNGQTLSWTTSTLAPGASGTVVFTVTVKPSAIGSVGNNAEIASSTAESDPSDNQASVQTNVGIPGLATIYGTVFEDSDGDGVQDADESGVPNVLITLDGTDTTTTNAAGEYYFLTPDAGVHTVVESDLVGYFSTTPNEVHVEVTLGDSFQVNFGDAPEGSGFASVFGTVFEDADGDGDWGAGETGIAGVTVTLDGGATVTTNQYGSYGFRVNSEGVHKVVESDPAGYLSTTPNEVHVDVELDSDYEVNFGDAPEGAGFASVFGTVFEDADGDGIWDADETGIEDVIVTLDSGATATTDQYGGYRFSNVDEGIHTVVESDPVGYFSTTPNEVHVDVVLNAHRQVDFGDAPEGSGFASVFGTVFEDLSGEGVWDASEVGIPNVTITLDTNQSATTNQYGSYTFVTTEEGSHTVEETDLPGYVSTTPNIVNVDVAEDNGYQVDFGDQTVAQCEDDSFEEDDTSAQASTIQIGEAFSQTHNFCGDAVDWVSFSAQAGDVYTITTSSWGQRADTFLSLYDVDGQSLLAANDDFEGTTDFSSRIAWEAPADGTYLVRITNRAGLIGGDTDYEVWIEGEVHFRLFLPYVGKDTSQGTSSSLNVVMAPTGVINHACPDVYEVDDTWQEAGAILPGATQTHSFDSNPAQYAADKDFVWFDLRARDIVTFTITQANNTQTLLELYDSNGDALDITGSTQIVWEATESGRFYLSVSPVDTMNFGCADVVSYDLKYELEPINVLFLPTITR